MGTYEHDTVYKNVISELTRQHARFPLQAYVYVGLYGYSYMEAGHKVMSLFAQRGWATIITDDLVIQVLNLVCLVVGGITGCVGLAVAAAHKSWVSEFPENESVWVPFLFGFLIGYAMSSILVSPALTYLVLIPKNMDMLTRCDVTQMSVLASAVDTVIVCFAEAPNALQTNYPMLSDQMLRAWRMTYPQEFIIPQGELILEEQLQGEGQYPDQGQALPLSVLPVNKSDAPSDPTSGSLDIEDGAPRTTTD